MKALALILAAGIALTPIAATAQQAGAGAPPAGAVDSANNKTAFDNLDSDKDGFLSWEELSSANTTVTEEQYMQLDTDGTGLTLDQANAAGIFMEEEDEQASPAQ